MVRIFKTRETKSYRSLLLFAFTFFLGIGYASGQVDLSTINHAVKILKGLESDNTADWAISTLEDAAINYNSAYAMNCLGIAYMGCLGVESDSAKAVSWLENAGKEGYKDAYHNLGMIYKYSRCGVKQDLEKAYSYFSVGASKGSVSCMYDKGYMLYKGLGCSQNYTKAIKKFRAAAELMHIPSFYMLGLCYRNGYGTKRDTVMASEYLEYAAMMGNRDAKEELERPNAETYLSEFQIGMDIPDKMPQISPQVNDTSLIAGCYHGFLVTYDWSGEYVLSERPMAMTVFKEKAEVHGYVILGTDTVSFMADVTDDNRLVFRKGDLKLRDRYTNSGVVKYRIDNMLYDVWDDKICGRLNLYSLKQKEPERPMYFELLRDGTHGLQIHFSCNVCK